MSNIIFISKDIRDSIRAANPDYRALCTAAGQLMKKDSNKDDWKIAGNGYIDISVDKSQNLYINFYSSENYENLLRFKLYSGFCENYIKSSDTFYTFETDDNIMVGLSFANVGAARNFNNSIVNNTKERKQKKKPDSTKQAETKFESNPEPQKLKIEDVKKIFEPSSLPPQQSFNVKIENPPMLESETSAPEIINDNNNDNVNNNDNNDNVNINENNVNVNENNVNNNENNVNNNENNINNNDDNVNNVNNDNNNDNVNNDDNVNNNDNVNNDDNVNNNDNVGKEKESDENNDNLKEENISNSYDQIYNINDNRYPFSTEMPSAHTKSDPKQPMFALRTDEDVSRAGSIAAAKAFRSKRGRANSAMVTKNGKFYINNYEVKPPPKVKPPPPNTPPPITARRIPKILADSHQKSRSAPPKNIPLPQRSSPLMFDSGLDE